MGNKVTSLKPVCFRIQIKSTILVSLRSSSASGSPKTSSLSHTFIAVVIRFWSCLLYLHFSFLELVSQMFYIQVQRLDDASSTQFTSSIVLLVLLQLITISFQRVETLFLTNQLTRDNLHASFNIQWLQLSITPYREYIQQTHSILLIVPIKVCNVLI